MNKEQIDINEKILIKRIRESKNKEWLIKLMQERFNFTEKEIEEIKSINSIKIQEILRKNYKVNK